MLSPATMPAKAFVFPHGPANQKLVEMAKDRVQRGPIEAAVVLNPTTEDRIPHARQVVNGFVAPQGQPPAPHLLAHLSHRVRAHRRGEVDEELAPSILRPPRAKRITQEIEPFLGIPARPVVILAVDDTRLAGMDFQSTLREPTSDALQDLLRLRLRPAVRDNIICVPLEWHAGMYPAHPVVECEVQKDIRRQRTDHSALRRPLRPRHQRPILQLGGSFEPPLEIEENPRALRALPHSAKHQFVVEIIEGTYDTLPVISTSPRRSLLSALAIHSKADRSTCSVRCIGKVGYFSF